MTKFYKFLLVSIFLILCFFPLLLSIPGINFIDESMTIFLGSTMYFLFLIDSNFVTSRLDNWAKITLCLLLIFFMIGLIPTILYHIQKDTTTIFKDAFLFIKFPLCYTGAMVVFNNMSKEDALTTIWKIIKISTSIIFFFGLASIFINLNMGSSVRYGIRSYQFLFPHYTYLVYSVVMMLSILTLENKKNFLYKGMLVAILALTLRSKAFIFIFFYILLHIGIKIFKTIKIKHLLILLVLSAVLSKEKISNYMSWGIYNLRTGLYIVGFKIANDYFPFGTGFGTYGSNLSKKAGSPIYTSYDLIYSQGLRKGTGDFPMSDVFWPYIIGQWGYLGLICFILLLSSMYLSIVKRTDLLGERYYIGALLLFFYILIASGAEAIFTNETGVYLVVIISIFFGKTEIRGEELQNGYLINR